MCLLLSILWNTERQLVQLFCEVYLLVHHIFKNTFHIFCYQQFVHHLFKTHFCYQQLDHHIFQIHLCYQQFVHHIFKHISVTSNLSSAVTKNCVIKKEVTIFCIGNCLLFVVCVTPAKVSPPHHYILPLTNRAKQAGTELWLVKPLFTHGTLGARSNRVKLCITSRPNCKSCK